MKRSPLLRKTPLRAKLALKPKPMARATAKPRPGEDAEHLANVRRLPCCARSLDACMGPIQAHHHTHGRGKGTKVADTETMPLCLKHHHDFHAATGAFKTMDQEARRAWQDAMVEQTKALLGT